jgi:hypothetical protein
MALPDLDSEAIEVKPFGESGVLPSFSNHHWNRSENEWSRRDILIGVGFLMAVFVLRRKLMRIWRLAMG